MEAYKNKVICGDCLEFMRGLPDNSVDVVITDPPYGVRKTEKWDEREHFLESLDTWISECLRVTKSGLLWFCADKMLPDILKRHSEYFQRALVWDKPPGSQFAGAMKNKIWYSAEFILVYDKKDLGKKGKYAGYFYTCHQSRTIPKKKYGHPTTKPLELISWLVEHYSDEGDVILDPFLGSGTTAVAALSKGRFFVGIEQQEQFCDIAKKRIAEFC